MSKAEGQNIGIKFTLPVNNLPLANIVAANSAYSVPTGTVTYSNQYSTTYSASKAFDNSTSTYWDTRITLPQWNMIELAETRLIAGFRMYSGSSYRPNSVDLYGSNDGVNFDLIIQTINTNTTGWKEYTFEATMSYKYYKWVVNSTYTSGRVYIYELQLLFATVIPKSGNESAFTVLGQEYTWFDGADNNGALVNKVYTIKTVQTHPTEPNSIQLIMLNEIRNAQGDITISYNQALGTLAGTGGVIASFTKTFTPEDLIEGLTTTGGAIGMHEHIKASVDGIIDLIYITKLSAYTPIEYVKASIGGKIQFINVDDINP